MSALWWLAAPDARLSQGDVVSQVALVKIVEPPVTVVKKTVAKEGVVWAPDSSIPFSHAVVSAARHTVLVLSHSCELDKNEKKARVLVAPIRTADTLETQVYEQVFAQRRRSLMPLPGVPTIGDCYADLRLMQNVPRDGLVERVASMTEDGIQRLHAQLVGYLVRPPNG